MTQQGDEEVDFFISYTKADEEAAKWVAWQLEEAGFSTLIQAWDFGAGSNFVTEMDLASRRSRRTMPILSDAFFASGFTQPEWAQAFAKDPTGAERRVMPVRVRDCEVDGLLGQIVYIDLVGLTEEQAAVELIARVRPGRGKPTTPPPAPDFGAKAARSSVPSNPSRLEWRPTDGSIDLWRSSLRTPSSSSGNAMVEVQFRPVGATLISAVDLSLLPQRLTEAGRLGGLFAHDQAVESQLAGDLAVSTARDPRSGQSAGLMATRQSQRGIWVPLPRDMMGTVFDPEEVAPRLSAAIALLFSVDAGALAERYLVGARIAPGSMVLLGDAQQVGSRTSSRIRMAWDDIATPVDDSLLGSDIASHSDAVAAELVARLALRLG